MTTLKATDEVETFEELCLTICWDDFEDPEVQLAGGVYVTCAGEWRREADGRWRFWEDPKIMAELRASTGNV